MIAMRLSILQPSFFPWLGYFDQMARVDTFVYLDDVQYTRRDWRNRNRIRTKDGWMWLTVPVVSRGRFLEPLKETRIDNSVPWKSRHRSALRHNYCKSPYFDRYFSYFDSVYEKEWTFLLDICYETLEFFRKELGIDSAIQFASDLNLTASKDEKILEICKRLGAECYLTGDKARGYLDTAAFDACGVELEYQEYKHPEYQQAFSGFEPYLSVIDLLFNEGGRSLEILRKPEVVTDPAGA